MTLGGLDNVIFADLVANISDAERSAEHLARLAVDSMSAGDRNGIRYLADNIEAGIVTPLTAAYRDAILQRTGAADLTEAESKAKREQP